MLVVVVTVSRVKMAVVQVVIVATMRYAQMAARFTMNVGMAGMGVMTCHFTPPSLLETCRSQKGASSLSLASVLTALLAARRQPLRTAEVSFPNATSGILPESESVGDFYIHSRYHLNRPMQTVR